MARLLRIEADKAIFTINPENITYMTSHKTQPGKVGIHFGADHSIIVPGEIHDLTMMINSDKAS